MEIFRNYDIRGYYPQDINKENAYRIGRAFVAYLQCKKVVVGRDMRLSSPEIHSGLIGGIIDQGADVIDLGLSSTDLLYFSVINNDYPAGIMVTASHCGKELNGMKLVRENAAPVSMGSGLELIKELYNQDNFSEPEQKGNLIKKDFLPDFTESNLSRIDPSSLKPLKIVCDTGNGMGGHIIPQQFHRLPLKIIPLYFELDGSFPHHQANPLLPEAREKISGTIRKENADLGLLWDGDADRLAVLDEQGHFIQSDFLLGFLAKYLLQENPYSTIVYDLRCSWYVEEMIKKNQGKGVISKVGYTNIKSLMEKHQALFGGEMSGHFFWKFKGGYPENTFLTALKLIEIISKENKKASRLFSEFNDYFTSGEINFKVENKKEVIRQLKETYSDGKQLELDGISIYYPDWKFNVRESANDPVIRLTLEANSPHLLETKKQEVIKIIASL